VADPALCKYLSPVVVVEDYNDNVRCTVGATTGTATIAAGTYYISGDGTASDLLVAIDTALTAVAGTWTLSLTSGVISFLCAGGTWSIDWDYTGTGFYAFDATILGIASISAAFGAATGVADACDYQHQRAWYSSRAVAVDSGRTPIAVTSQTVAPSGRVSTVQRGSVQYRRDVSHEAESAAKTWPTSGSNNQDWLSFWRTACAGQTIRYYPDVSVTTAFAEYTGATGYYICLFDDETCKAFDPDRMSAGLEVYSWSVGLLGYV
jgi:hypothetical protein